MESIQQALHNQHFTPVTPSTKIFKDECNYCFKTPQSPGGLYICMSSYHAFCRNHLNLYNEISKKVLFLQMETRKIVRDEPSPRPQGEPNNKIQKMLIDSVSNIEYDDSFHILTFPDVDNRLPINEELEQVLFESAKQVINCTSAERITALTATTSTWDDDIKLFTQHANLTQLNNGKKIPYSGWKCEEEGCDLEENLWLSLTDGSIRCGRSQFLADGLKSVGNNHMKMYYEKTGYPLVVKLGTICSQIETADVYSYDENDSVIDPNLDRHLAHFGLDATKMKKTSKSTMEMEIDLNNQWEWSKCQEDGLKLEPIYGPGYTGIINTGSSCYMNSVLQAFFEIDTLRKFYAEGAVDIFKKTEVDKVYTDFNSQMAKVFGAMLSGDYSLPDESAQNGIKPVQFKKVAAGTHSEFSSAKQQDVEEYIRFLLERISNSTDNLTQSVKFQTINRFEDVASGKVRYTEQEDCIIHLAMPIEILEKARNELVDEQSRFNVSFEAALSSTFGPQFVDGYESPITKEKKGATNTLSLKTFPDYLMIQVQKFAYSNDGTMKKLDIDLNITDEIDLSAFRGHGKRENEELLPDNASTDAPVQIPENYRHVVDELKSMGFGENACLRAVYAGGGNMESATNWMMEHLDDPTLNDPYVPESKSNKKKNGVEPQTDLVEMLMELGFTQAQAKYSLVKFSNNVEQASNWLYTNTDEINYELENNSKQEDEEATAKNSTTKKIEYKDGCEKYQLIGMISHMGTRPCSGHYVAHILKNGKWVLFNDEKVALSQEPPKKLAYVYLYKRATVN